MEGRSRAALRLREDAIALAWHTVALDRQKRLKPLGSYLSALQPKKPTTSEELLAGFQALASRGKATVRKVR
jgi:hypothetical protein